MNGEIRFTKVKKSEHNYSGWITFTWCVLFHSSVGPGVEIVRSYHHYTGQSTLIFGNSSILSLFCKKFDNMPIFWNYLGPYPYFETWFTQNWVQRRYRSLKHRYKQKKKKKKFMELDLEKIKFQNIAIRLLKTPL